MLLTTYLPILLRSDRPSAGLLLRCLSVVAAATLAASCGQEKAPPPAAPVPEERVAPERRPFLLDISQANSMQELRELSLPKGVKLRALEDAPGKTVLDVPLQLSVTCSDGTSRKMIEAGADVVRAPNDQTMRLGMAYVLSLVRQIDQECRAPRPATP